MGLSWKDLTEIMSKIIKVLVTGAGAVLGQGILRSLHDINTKLPNLEIHTADPDFRSSGHWLSDKAHLIPMAYDENYEKIILSIIKEEGINFILIGTDVELTFFSKNKLLIEKSTGAKIIVSPEEVIAIANDKFLTAQFLKENGFPFPKSVMANNASGIKDFLAENNLPFLAKPVDGARSKGVVLIDSIVKLNEVLENPKNLVIQEFLSEEEGEFTSGAVVIKGKCVSVVTLRRDLRDGNTYRAYYKNEYEKYTSFISNVAEVLKVDGPVNFQFRISNGQPKIFEINGRFSGTTPIRYMFGFNEVNSILRHYVYEEEVQKPKLREGVVLRSWSDLFIDEDVLNHFSNNNFLKNPKSEYFGFKL